MKTIPAVLELIFVFAVGAVTVAALAALLRAGVRALLERQGHRLDRWRRVWLHPEREAGVFLEALLVWSFVAGFVAAFSLPRWVTAAVAGLWALHLLADAWSWLCLRRRPHDTRALHDRGFLLLDLGPLWLRLVVVVAAAAFYFLLPPARAVLDTIMGFWLGLLRAWLG